MAAATTATATTMTDVGETPQETFHIGTRRSLLARVQADQVVKALKEAWPAHHFEIHAMSTTGDNNQTTALHKFNEKSLWTQELEVLLESKELDLIVHSLKDMPTQLPIDLILGAVTAREDPRDALVIKPTLAGTHKSLAELPPGSIIGTSSLRRIAQLKRHFPHLRFADVRGNIGTRLAKLDDPASEYSAIILAVAGLARLGMHGRITTYLSQSNGGMLHAVGQGALGIETRKDDTRTAELVAKISCERSTRRALAERSLMRTLEGGCSVPIGVETEWVVRKGILDADVGVGVKPASDYHQVSGKATTAGEEESADLTDEMILRAIVVSLDGQEAAEVELRKRITNRDDADQFGRDIARELVAKGADKILQGITLNRDIVEEQGQA